jgi:hypothetical protein
MRAFHGGKAIEQAILNVVHLAGDCGFHGLFTRLSVKIDAKSMDDVHAQAESGSGVRFRLIAWHFLRRRQIVIAMPAVRLGDIRRTAGLQEDRRKAEIVERYLQGEDALALVQGYGVRKFWQRRGGVSPGLIKRWVKVIAGLDLDSQVDLPRIGIDGMMLPWPDAVHYIRAWARGKEWDIKVWPYRPEELADKRRGWWRWDSAGLGGYIGYDLARGKDALIYTVKMGDKQYHFCEEDLAAVGQDMGRAIRDVVEATGYLPAFGEGPIESVSGIRIGA